MRMQPMRQSAIAFNSKKLSLEGVIAFPEEGSGSLPALLVCHPHPMLGGNMDNPVVMALCRAAVAEGMASLRFNFRGVGGSEGDFGDGRGEQEDLKAALNVLRRWPGIDGKRLALVGYSFGASVILDGLRHYKSARSLILIAAPISSVERSPILANERPKLFLVGQRDGLVSSVHLQSALDGVTQPVEFGEVPEADHGLGGHESAVAERAVEFAVRTLRDDGG